jgi:sugar phosphate isomerase/epimerase
LAELVGDAGPALAAADQLALRWLVAPSPLPAADGGRMTLDDWRRTAEALNRVGETVTRAGRLFAYHNHADEFERHGEVSGLHELMRLTDPALVRLELDVGWATIGGREPAALIRRYGGRVALLHAKDVRRTPDGFAFTEIGRGVIDWPAVFAAAQGAGVRGVYVEQDPPHARPPLESLQISFAALQAVER